MKLIDLTKMNKKKLTDFMSFNRETHKIIPLFTSPVNGKFIIAVYQGSISKYDILIKYRQKDGDNWSRIRTPKHIHWAVDILIKMHSDKTETERFLGFLVDIWDKTGPIKSKSARARILDVKYLLETNKKEIKEYEKLGQKGEYSIKFLILLAKLLMIQEKTNLETAYMFKELLNSLRSGKDIFGIVSKATHRGK